MLQPIADICANCGPRAPLDIAFTYAFQPIVDMRTESVYSYEALVRGPNNESAFSVLAQVNDINRYRFDQACRVKAIALAASLGIKTNLNINFMPNAIYQPENCIQTTFAAAKRHGFPIERVIFEVVENDPLPESSRLVHIMNEYKRFGFLTALDDFGAGFRDLQLLADFQPNLVKIDMALIRGVASSPARQAIVHGVIAMCDELRIQVLGEGVETAEEYAWLSDAGVDLFQGYFFARPAFEAAESIDLRPFRRAAARGRRQLELGL